MKDKEGLNNLEKALLLIFALIGIAFVLHYLLPCKASENCFQAAEDYNSYE